MKKLFSGLMVMLVLGGMASTQLYAQNQSKPVAAVLGVDSKGLSLDGEALAYILRLELEKVNVFTLMDKYDVAEKVKSNNINVTNCFGKTCLVAAGAALGVDKMVTGSIDRFGEKIVIVLKVIDVKSASVERQNATEYVNLQNELQRMIGISVQLLLGLSPDQNVVNLLINYDAPVESPKTQMKLDGPRMGFSLATGDAADVLSAPESVGGFDMFPATFQFGWQKEWQYLSSGDFQALIEFIPMIGGLESGKFIPSVTFLNGFRVGKRGWEFAFGPSFRVVRKLDGYMGDGQNGTQDGVFYPEDGWMQQYPNPYPITSRLDSRGTPEISTALFIGIGKTFHSGYLNIPVNAYVLPRRSGTTVGLSFGFNIYKKAKVG
jgi:hypothetical protein